MECELNGIFIWTPEEAKAKEYKQIGVSACGATAVLNILVSGVNILNARTSILNRTFFSLLILLCSVRVYVYVAGS